MALDATNWAGRRVPTLVRFKRSPKEAFSTFAAASIVWYATHRWGPSMEFWAEAAASLIVVYLLLPLAEVSWQAFRAPSIELQHENEKLRSDVAALRADVARLDDEFRMRFDATPDAQLRVVQEGEMVYLEVTNKGPVASFHAMLRQEGVSDWPQKDVFARWDDVFEINRRIPRNVSARLRLAKMEAQHGAFQWRVYLYAMKWMDKLSERTAFVGSSPPSDKWSVRLDLAVIADPDLRNGPVAVSVELCGDGHVRLLGSDTAGPSTSSEVSA